MVSILCFTTFDHFFFIFLDLAVLFLSSRFFYQEIRTIALMQHYRKLSNWLKNNIWNMKLFSVFFCFQFSFDLADADFSLRLVLRIFHYNFLPSPFSLSLSRWFVHFERPSAQVKRCEMFGSVWIHSYHLMEMMINHKKSYSICDKLGTEWAQATEKSKPSTMNYNQKKCMMEKLFHSSLI